MKTKTQNFYNSREEYEKKHPYVEVEAPNWEGKKCGIAQIVESFRTRKQAEERTNWSSWIMTRRQAEKYIKIWNSEYEAGNLRINIEK